MGIETAIIILVSSISAYTDWKTGEIPNWVTYPFIAIGILLSASSMEYAGIIFGLIILVIGKFFLQNRFGGGDIKLLIGIAIMQPYLNNQIFVLNVLLIASMLGVIWMIGNYLAARATKRTFDWNSFQRFGPFIMAGVVLGFFGLSVILNA